MKKISLTFLVLFILFGIYSLSQDSENKFTKFLKDKTHWQIKKILKDTIFYIPVQVREFKKTKNANIVLLEKNFSLKKNNDILNNRLNYGTIDIREINNKYKIKKIIPPFYDDTNIHKNIKSGFLEIYKGKIVVAFTKGKIIYLDQNFSEGEKFTKIDSNLDTENYFDEKINWAGIKDLKIKDDIIYISITREVENNCYSPAILYAKIDLNYLDFKYLFKVNECVSTDRKIKAFAYFNGYQTGGRMVDLDNSLYLSVGDYNSWELPQKDESIFGKILEINLSTNKYKIISKGHRNHQGLSLYSLSKKLLISSEHGPKGGDEINIIAIDESIDKNNYGWPMASYGNHYDVVPLNGFTNKFAPLHKSHTKYGYKEPSIYFKKSIAPSEIIKNFFSEKNQFFLTTLKSKTIFVIEFNKEKLNAEVVDEIFIGDRIRDIVFNPKKNTYYLYLERTPYIAELSKQ